MTSSVAILFVDVAGSTALFRLATETGNQIGGFMRYLTASDQRGHKFRTNAPKAQNS
jgi:hypothetical protein